VSESLPIKLRGSGLRWVLPGALLLVEYVTLSFLVDLPTSGSAVRLAGVLRMLVPVVIGAGAAGWLLTGRVRLALLDVSQPLPPWRPFPALPAHLAAFGATAAIAFASLREGAPSPTTGALAALSSCAGLTALLALSSAAPLRWTLRVIGSMWRIPLLAVAVGILSWRAAAAAESLWGILSTGTLHAVAWVLRLSSDEVTVDVTSNLIGVGAFEVLVAPVCSGVDGLGMVLVFQALWIALARARLRFPRALVLLPLGAVAALGANVLRISALLVVGASGWEELAFGGLHSKLGWIVFIGIALGTVAIAEKVHWLQRPAPAPAGAQGVSPAAVAYLAPFLGALATGLLTSIWADGPLDRWYGARILVAAAVLVGFRRSLPRPSLALSWAPALLAAGLLALYVAGSGDGQALTAGLARLGDPERWAWLAIRVFGSCLVIPVVEELAFRGFLLPWLVSPDFESVPPRTWTWPAVVFSSLAFGAVHQQWVLGTLAGFAFAAARLRRGRLSDAILAHAIANAGVAAAVVLGGRWELWR
jgi:exosortase E/protease (VPEID-CTERM system)